MTSLHRLLCYDVVENRRRMRLHKGLRNFLLPVQKSVFEGRIAERHMPRLLKRVGHEIDEQTDTVRIYSLCASCTDRIILVGTARPVEIFDEPILFGF